MKLAYCGELNIYNFIHTYAYVLVNAHTYTYIYTQTCMHTKSHWRSCTKTSTSCSHISWNIHEIRVYRGMGIRSSVELKKWNKKHMHTHHIYKYIAYMHMHIYIQAHYMCMHACIYTHTFIHTRSQGQLRNTVHQVLSLSLLIQKKIKTIKRTDSMPVSASKSETMSESESSYKFVRRTMRPHKKISINKTDWHYVWVWVL